MPGKSRGQRNLVGYSPWGHKELDTTEHACVLTHTVTYTYERKEWPQAKWPKRRCEEVRLGTVDGNAYIIC